MAERVARYGRMEAAEGRGGELAELMLAEAAKLEDLDGCLIYLVNRSRSDPDSVWITELWRSQEDLDASIADIDPESVAKVRELVVDGGMIELDLLGGKGPA
ncbi:antibiotic biosynthesis monooxygenase [Thermoleophilia bacterium SCSIO 60948]|nr:antibiotic biosynthesis monooxygenase [Thermoleophilia bacterium SCSIO 60948]